MNDRRVHAAYDGMAIVRYDKQGKWYLEPTDTSLRRQWYLEPTDTSLRRQSVSVREAAQSAVWGAEHGGRIAFGLPGGSRFDRLVRRAVSGEDTDAVR